MAPGPTTPRTFQTTGHAVAEVTTAFEHNMKLATNAMAHGMCGTQLEDALKPRVTSAVAGGNLKVVRPQADSCEGANMLSRDEP